MDEGQLWFQALSWYCHSFPDRQ